MTSCNVVEYQHFRRTYFLHRHGRSDSKEEAVCSYEMLITTIDHSAIMNCGLEYVHICDSRLVIYNILYS